MNFRPKPASDDVADSILHSNHSEFPLNRVSENANENSFSRPEFAGGQAVNFSEEQKDEMEG